MLTFVDFFLGVHKRAMWLPVLAEIGRFPLGPKIISQTIAYWIHILNSNSYLRKIYNSMLRQNIDDVPWIKFIKQILFHLGFDHVWQNQDTFNVHKLKHAIQIQLQEKYIEFWKKQKAKHSSKLKFNDAMCPKYEVQRYLLQVKNIEHRCALSKLRTSTHTLKIETGRHQGIARENRLCIACNVIEDEFHFLDECIKNTDTRNKLLKDIYVKNSELMNYKPSDLLLQDDNVIQGNIAKFVSDCFK